MFSDIKNWIYFPLIAKLFGSYFSHKSLSGFPKNHRERFIVLLPGILSVFFRVNPVDFKAFPVNYKDIPSPKKRKEQGQRGGLLGVLPYCIQDFEGWRWFGYLKSNAHRQEKKKKDWLHTPQKNRTRQDLNTPCFLLYRHVCLSSEKLWWIL